MAPHPSIPVIDLFAGPGGLSEGFTSLSDDHGRRQFDVRVSVEKDEVAHRTLALRALFRSFPDGSVPDPYYDYVRGHIARTELFSSPLFRAHGEQAGEEARCAELGKTPHQTVDSWIRKAVGNASEWVLIGGPPCQAYSLAGRSRLRPGNEIQFENDERHFLYREYLRVIRLFGPSVFVMENVKGLLTSKHAGTPIFERILSDLRRPGNGWDYEVRSLVVDDDAPKPLDYLIEAEAYGVPQCRHRVILFGVRSDLAGTCPTGSVGALSSRLTPSAARVSVGAILSGLPPLRSRLSTRTDSLQTWRAVLKAAPSALKGWHQPLRSALEERMWDAWESAASLQSFGQRFDPHPVHLSEKLPKGLRKWIYDKRLEGVLQHEARAHMAPDLHRYLFAACFAQLEGYSPRLRLFPVKLLPNHKNLDSAEIPFVDRFKVQIAAEPSSTVVSHICKDGHYFIHPDPAQCRSLTVREAARLQTFPDNYFFEGTRTQQYHQVGNAVPPWLAQQIADVVLRFLNSSRYEARSGLRDEQAKRYAAA